MGRQRKAWLPNGTGRVVNARPGRTYPGYYVFWREYGPDGSSRYRSKHFAKQAHAREWCRQYNARVDLHAIGEVMPISIRDAFTEFIAGISARAPETLRIYTAAVAQFEKVVGSILVCEVGREHIDKFIAYRMDAGSEATAAKYVTHLYRFFAWCVESECAIANPVKSATTLPRKGIVRKKPRITDAEFTMLLDALDTEDRKLAVQIAATTGLDRGVIQRIPPRDVDLDARTFRVERRKTHRSVTPPIHDSILPAIRQRCDRTEPSRPLLSGLAHQGGIRIGGSVP